ncbi:hypothetical protein MJO28_008757 [Puccinia striiformis f. sp. tritici]|uniref:Uncharacterized protein n=1 Tax=Puccinia striiformis f. sp. tritici TaxID=168172 RepID=A0ACC0EBB5_9BASI|nr:hypothetical protein MJO28_008757 [Puccinia striiformis f. sp. tritici]
MSSFLNKSKSYISPLLSKSRSWGELMWAIGWRKLSDKDQIVGKYIKKFTPEQVQGFDEHFMESKKVEKIIGHHFKQLAKIPFGSNQELMKKNNIPSLAALEYGEELEESDCSPHLTFTTDGFFYCPYTNDEDISDFAFTLFLPTHSEDGRLVSSTDKYDVSSGPFIFPDYKFGIEFNKNSIVKMIWQAN